MYCGEHKSCFQYRLIICKMMEFILIFADCALSGHVSIRDGLHSQAPLLANTTSTLHQTAAAQMTALNQDNAFVSGVITKNSKTGVCLCVCVWPGNLMPMCHKMLTCVCTVLSVIF